MRYQLDIGATGKLDLLADGATDEVEFSLSDSAPSAVLDPARAGSYRYDIESGPVASGGGALGEVDGETLLALRSGQFSDAKVLKQARLLMRRIIDHHLEGRPLNSRQLFQRPGSSTNQ